MDQAQKRHRRFKLPGEAALALGLVINAFAVRMMIMAGFGMSVVSSVPYTLSIIAPNLSMGTWSWIVQTLWIALLMLYLRRVRWGYLASFLLSFPFGYLLDFWGWALAGLPTPLVLRFVWYAIGLLCLALGICLLMRCGLPVLPFDVVPRDLVAIRGWSVRAARTGFDVFHLLLSAAFGLVFLGRIVGIGVGSVVNALALGTLCSAIMKYVDKHLEIAPKCGFLARLT